MIQQTFRKSISLFPLVISNYNSLSYSLVLSKRWHGTHHHHHHHHQTDSSKEGTRVTILGLFSNIGLTMIKGTGGVLYNSSSLMAEALHSLGDLLSDFITLAAYKTARSRKADKSYPYGYGKTEPLGGLGVSLLLVGGSIGMAGHSFHQFQEIFQGNGISEITLESFIMSPWAAVLLVGSIGVKEWLYRITLKVGKKTQSSVLIANAYHHRSDVYSSIVALAGVAGASNIIYVICSSRLSSFRPCRWTSRLYNDFKDGNRFWYSSF